ncbi:MAG: ATP-binding protein [Fibrobacterales bacterium]
MSIQLLILEDNPVDLSLLRGLVHNITSLDCTIETAKTLQEALTHITETTFDIILSDLNLPDSKGLDTLNKLTTNTDDTPIIVITGEFGGDIGIKAVSAGAQDYLSKGKFDVTLLEKSITYAIERKQVSLQYNKSEEHHKKLIDSLPIGIMNLDNNGHILFANPQMFTILKTPPPQMVGKSIFDFMPSDFEKKMLQKQFDIMQNSKNPSYNYSGKRITKEKKEISVNCSITGYEFKESGIRHFTVLTEDVTHKQKSEDEKKRLESQLLQSQKMESIGTLAAGVAHEINTPIQFIGDNTLFIKDSIYNVFLLLREYENTVKEIVQLFPDHESITKLEEHLEQTAEEIDIDFLKNEMPTALTQSMEGVSRVTNIVKAMKDFSHSGSENMALESVNSAIESTIVIAKNEWKYCADLETTLSDSLPLVKCYIGEIKQVILNLIINASHAIIERFKGTHEKGFITVSTSATETHIVIVITDNGSGIPEEIQDKVFDHFFTTKEVGVGTGQGLSMAYQTITAKHKGSIGLKSIPGEGTTFTIKLPLEQKD